MSWNYATNWRQGKIIKDWLKTAPDGQKSYVDLKKCEIEHEVGDEVLLKVSLWKKIMRFGQRWNLVLDSLGLKEVLKRVGPWSSWIETSLSTWVRQDL